MTEEEMNRLVWKIAKLLIGIGLIVLALVLVL